MVVRRRSRLGGFGRWWRSTWLCDNARTPPSQARQGVHELRHYSSPLLPSPSRVRSARGQRRRRPSSPLRRRRGWQEANGVGAPPPPRPHISSQRKMEDLTCGISLLVREGNSGVGWHVNDMWGPLISFRKPQLLPPNGF